MSDKFFTIFLDINTGLEDKSLSLKEYDTPATSLELETGNYLYVGYCKPFNSFYLELETVSVSNAELTAEYYNGSVWKPFQIYDETQGFAKSGFMYFDKYEDMAMLDIEDKEKFYIRLSPSVATGAVTGKLLDILFSSDLDLEKIRENIVSKYSTNNTFVSKHIAARDHIIQEFRNRGNVKEVNKEIFTTSNFVKDYWTSYDRDGDDYTFSKSQIIKNTNASGTANNHKYNIEINGDATLEFELADDDNNAVLEYGQIGFQFDDVNESYSGITDPTIYNGFTFFNTRVQFKWGTVNVDKGNFDLSDKFKVEKKGDDILFYINDELIDTFVGAGVDTNYSFPYSIGASISSSGFGFKNIKITSDAIASEPSTVETTEDLIYKDITKFDFLEPMQLRVAAKYLALYFIFWYELSDEEGDKWQLKAAEMYKLYEQALATFFVALDLDNDGSQGVDDKADQNAIRTIVLGKKSVRISENE